LERVPDVAAADRPVHPDVPAGGLQRDVVGPAVPGGGAVDLGEARPVVGDVDLVLVATGHVPHQRDLADRQLRPEVDADPLRVDVRDAGPPGGAAAVHRVLRDVGGAALTGGQH